MHELPATQGILAVSLEAAARRGARRVWAIDLVVGELSSILDDSVQFYFDLLSRDTAAAGARLRFQRKPAHARCLSCGHEEPVRPPLSPSCVRCGSPTLRVTGGQEFYVASIEVDDESPGGDGDPEGE